jgi:ADP-ribosylglycohydrolase/protein-tyrosine phosphatase
MAKPELASRLAGAIWGHLVGDAVGVPYEFTGPIDQGAVTFGATGTWQQPPGTWSDDGALMLALLDSLLATGFDPEDQGRRALAWYRSGAYTPDHGRRFDVGSTTRAALEALEHGAPARDSGPADEQASGNGSLMRILPLALVERDATEADLVRHAHLASRMTHGHFRCQMACALYSLTIRALLRAMEPTEAAAWASRILRRIYTASPELAGHLAALDELRDWPEHEGRTFVIDSFWSAWDAFAGAGDYEATIRRAVAYGNDTDTTAAIAGGLAGVYWGWEGIPRDWRRRMRGQDVAGPLVDRLVETLGWKTSTGNPLRIDGIDLSDLIPLRDPPVDEAPVDGSLLGITFLPGKKRIGYTGGHWRDLDLDLTRLHQLGADTLFLLVEDPELELCLVTDLPDELARRHADGRGPELLRFPIHDPHTPPPERDADFRAAIVELAQRVRGGRSVAIACRGGLDRSGMTAACLLQALGLPAEEAIERVHRSRRGSLTMPDQLDYVRRFRVD